MHLNAEPIKAIMQETGRLSGLQGMVCLFGSRKKEQRGFTMVELITAMILIGILAAAAMPRFFDRSTFDSRSFYDQTIATLRYAQKTAIAQHRFVCVSFTANSITLTQSVTNACGGALASPAGTAAYVINAPNGVTLAGGANFNFNSVGQPNAGQSITVSGYAVPITVEAVTGYVH